MKIFVKAKMMTLKRILSLEDLERLGERIFETGSFDSRQATVFQTDGENIGGFRNVDPKEVYDFLESSFSLITCDKGIEYFEDRTNYNGLHIFPKDMRSEMRIRAKPVKTGKESVLLVPEDIPVVHHHPVTRYIYGVVSLKPERPRFRKLYFYNRTINEIVKLVNTPNNNTRSYKTKMFKSEDF